MRSFAALVLIILGQNGFALQQNLNTGQKSSQSLSISGTVLRADTRAPLPNVQVIAIDSSSQAQGTDSDDDAQPSRQLGTISDAKGNFTFEHLQPGVYRLLASHAGMMLRQGSSSLGIIVQLQGESQKLVLLMLQSGAIAGRILNEQGEPMQDVTVAALRYVYSMRGRRLQPVRSATSDDKGEYRLYGLKPGSYLVRAGAMRSLGDTGVEMLAQPDGKKASVKIYAPAFYPNASTPDQASPVAVKGGDEAVANFFLARVPGHRVSGKVVGLPPPAAQDSPRRFCYVLVAPEGASLPMAEAPVAKDSSFEIPALPQGKISHAGDRLGRERLVELRLPRIDGGCLRCGGDHDWHHSRQAEGERDFARGGRGQAGPESPLCGANRGGFQPGCGVL